MARYPRLLPTKHVIYEVIYEDIFLSKQGFIDFGIYKEA